MATSRPPRRPLNAESANSGAQLLTLPAPIQPTPAARSTRRPSGRRRRLFEPFDHRRAASASALERLDAGTRLRRRGGGGGDAAVAGGARAGSGLAAGGGGGLGGRRRRERRGDPDLRQRRLEQIDRLDGQHRRAPLGRRGRSGSVWTTVRPETLSLTQISATPEPKKIPNDARASALRSARSTVARRSTLLPTTSVSTSNRAAWSSPRTRASASVATAPGRLGDHQHHAAGRLGSGRGADGASPASSAPAHAARRPRPRSAARASFITSV